MYYAKKNKFDELIKKYDSINNFCNIFGVGKQTAYNLKNCCSVNENTVYKICEAAKIKIDDLFEVEENIKVIDEKDLTNEKLSDEIINGLIKKIETRMNVSCNRFLTKEILSIVNEIVIESMYSGYNYMNDKKERMMKEAIRKRRNG